MQQSRPQNHAADVRIRHVAAAKAQKQHIVLPEGNEERILLAAEILLLRDVVKITLLGNEAEIRQKYKTWR